MAKSIGKYVKQLIDNLPDVKKNFSSLTDRELLVGVPSEGKQRNDTPVTNATIAYINDNGSPAMNIPPRPFMRPGMERAKSAVIQAFKGGCEDCLDGSKTAVDLALHKAGIIAQSSIRARLNEGIPPPLAEGTLLARVRAKRGVKGATAELERRKAGKFASATLNAKPLINTGQLRNSINYVIRRK
jgi:hypothetical protein